MKYLYYAMGFGLLLIIGSIVVMGMMIHKQNNKYINDRMSSLEKARAAKKDKQNANKEKPQYQNTGKEQEDNVNPISSNTDSNVVED